MPTQRNSTEERILEAAEREFLLKGFAGARTTSIAEAAGVTHAMLHYYFRTKEKIFQKILSDKIELFKQSLRLPLEVDTQMSLEEMLSCVVATHFNLLRKNPDMPRFLINEVLADAARTEFILSQVKDTASHLCRVLQRKIDEAVQKGVAEKVDASELLLSILSLNVMTFVALPVMRKRQNTRSASQMLDVRLQENIEMVTRRLRK